MTAPKLAKELKIFINLGNFYFGAEIWGVFRSVSNTRGGRHLVKLGFDPLKRAFLRSPNMHPYADRKNRHVLKNWSNGDRIGLKH